MLHQNASILNHYQSCHARSFRRRFVLNSRLHPNHLCANSNGALHHRPPLPRPPEHVHDLNFLRHIFQPRVTLFPQHFRLVRIHRNNPVSRTLHILRHTKARPHRIGCHSHHRTPPIFFTVSAHPLTHHCLQPLRANFLATGEKHSHRAASSPLP